MNDASILIDPRKLDPSGLAQSTKAMSLAKVNDLDIALQAFVEMEHTILALGNPFAPGWNSAVRMTRLQIAILESVIKLRQEYKGTK